MNQPSLPAPPEHFACEADPAFGQEGLLKLPLPDGWPSEPVAGSPLLKDDKVVVCTRGDAAVGLIRVDTQGKLDTHFGDQGYFSLKVHALTAYLAVLPNGELLLTALRIDEASREWQLFATLLSADGTLLSHFGDQGTVRLGVGPAPTPDSEPALPVRIRVDSDGEQIVIGLSCQPHPARQWRALVLRLDARGSLDFHINRQGYCEFQFPGMHTLLSDIALLPGGETLATGVRWANGGARHGFIARLGRDGQLDASFGDDGFAPARGIKRASGFTCLGASHDDDSRWLLGCAASGDGDSCLLTVNTLDADGYVYPGYTGLLPLACTAVTIRAIQPNSHGAAFITGVAHRASGGKVSQHVFVACLLASGRFDGRFGQGTGIQWFDALCPPAPQPDGSLLLSTSTHTLQRLRPVRSRGDGRRTLAADGLPDPEFSGDGMRPLPASFFLPLIALEPVSKEQRILLGAAFANVAQLAGLTSRGAPDMSFAEGESILLELDIDDESNVVLTDLIVQPDRCVLLIARLHDYDNFGYPLVVRVLPNGELDRQFGERGTCLIREVDDFHTHAPRKANSWVGDNPSPRAVLLADGGLVLAFTNPGNGNWVDQMMVLKVTPQGRLDDDFGDEGITVLRYRDTASYSASIAVQAGGRLLVGGSADGQALFCQLHASGEVDTGFGEQGFTVISGTAEEADSVQIQDLAISPVDRSVLGMGRLNRRQGTVTGPQGMLVRLREDGSHHPTFNNLRLLSLYLPSANTPVACQVLRGHFNANGLILVAGNSEPVKSFMLARLLPDTGAYDPAFGDGGRMYSPDLPAVEELRGFAVQHNDRMLLSVSSSSAGIAVRRYLPGAHAGLTSAWEGFIHWLRRHWGKAPQARL